jgi:hypothetical protein
MTEEKIMNGSSGSDFDPLGAKAVAETVKAMTGLRSMALVLF